MGKGAGIKTGLLIIVIIIFIIMSLAFIMKKTSTQTNNASATKVESMYNYNSAIETQKDTRQFNILASEEMKDLESIVTDYAQKEGYNIHVDYAGTLEIMDKLNESQNYDAIWASNSIWTYMVDTSVAKLSNSKSIGITPIVFGIKKSKAQELGFVDKTVYTEDIIDAVSSGKLKFAMSNPTTTNSGASAYLGMLYTIAGNPEVLTEDILNDPKVKGKLKSFFGGLERTSGTEDFLEELFLNGDYEAVYSYESSIININKKLEAQGKEPLYVIYPFDGVPLSDNPFVYVDHKDEKKLDTFNEIQKYLLSTEGKKLLESKGRRTWYGGTNTNVDQTVFSPSWGINTTNYITPVKYPTSDVIKLALNVYQSQYRKPIHVVFCLDFSGSMIGEGYEELKSAMRYILSDAAVADNIQFAEDDIIDILKFANNVEAPITTQDGTKTDELIKAIEAKPPYGGTALYPAAAQALSILKNEDDDVRNKSIILMTDGEANIGNFNSLKKTYENVGEAIPIYSIMFGEASDKQLNEIAELTNAKVFDGKKDLVKAFKEVRGYN